MIKQITVFIKNEPGSLFHVTSILAKHDVDIRAINLAETADVSLLRLVATPSEKALKIFRDNNIKFVEHDVFGVEIKDKPGGLAEFAAFLTKNKINIEYLYPFITKSKDRSFLVLRPTDSSRAEKVLLKSGLKLLTEEEFYKV
ncbi:MAG TPA: amino acid-binding protein [Candidatus Altiarchaeales archaeon]|nr:amino acid-binding protein [Candidatus Altiarchaeales archaeon]